MDMDEEASNLSTFDIYSDLLLEQQTPGVEVSVDQLEKANVENEAKVKQLNEQLQKVQLQCKTLEEENIILKINISELFKTAQAELRRKDRQMEELEKRRPRYRRGLEDYKTSVNDRLRDLRNNSISHYKRSSSSSGAHHETIVDSQGLGDKRGTDRKKKSAETEQANPLGQSERPDRTSAETSPVGSDQNKDGERIIKTSDDRSKEQLLEKADGLRKYSDDCHSRAGESLGRQPDRSQPARSPHRETSHRSPNRSKDHKERTQHEISPRLHSSEHKQQTVHSSSKHSKDSVGDDRRHSQSRSPHRGRSSEQSKSRGRSQGSNRRSRRSDSRERKPEFVKTINEKQKEKVKERKEERAHSNRTEKSAWSCSERKRKHSSGRKPDPKSSRRSSHIAPNKKLRGHDKDTFPAASDGRRSQCNHAEGNKVNRETPVSADLIHKRSHRTSHVVSSRSVKGSACDDEHSRIRHKSDRKTKSLKRAKDTLHRKHSTPKKHRRGVRSRRLSPTSKASRSKVKTKELISAGHEDMDNSGRSDTEWVPKDSVEIDDPQYRKKFAAVMREEGVLQDELGAPEEDPATHSRTACTATEMPQNHDLEINEEFRSHSLYRCKEPESTVKDDEKINIAESEGQVNETTTSQSGTEEVVDGQFKTVILRDEKCPTEPRKILDTCQMEISRNQYSLPVCNLGTAVQENERLEAKEISSVILLPSESFDPSSSGVVMGESESKIYDTGGCRKSSSSIPSTPSESTCKSVLSKESAHVKDETDVPPNSTKDLNCIKSSNEAELTDVDLDERIRNIDESEVECNSGSVSIGEDSDLKQNATRKKTNDSFSEKILDVFGSNSFLWSDDVDSSMEVTCPTISDTLDLPFAKTSQDNSAGEDRSAGKPSKKLESFSDTLMKIFGSDSLSEGDDMETSKGALPNLTDVAPDGQPNSETLHGSTASPKSLPGSTENDGSADCEIKSGSILETILETYDNGSLTGFDLKFSSQTSPLSVLVTDEPIIQSEDAMFETLPSSSAEKSDSKAKNSGADPTSAAICNVDFRSSKVLHGQKKQSRWCLPDEHNTDATIELLTKSDSQNSYQKEDRTDFIRDTDVVKSTGKLPETTNERPEARVEKEYVEVKLKPENQAIKQEGILTKGSPTTLLGKVLDETHCRSDPNEQADLERISGVNIASPKTSDVSILDNVDMKSGLKTDLNGTDTSLIDNEDGEVCDSENQGAGLEGVHEADISIDPSGYDLLSCSASPVNGNLLTDSDNGSFSDQEYHADQVSNDQLSDQHVDDKLSEGEIASSDSETSTNVITKKEEAHQTSDRKPKRTRSKSLQKGSKREDKHSSSYKARGCSRDRHTCRKTIIEQDRLKFLEKKRKILEERQQALENPVRRRSKSKYRIKAAKDREHGSHSSMRIRLPSRESPEKRRVTKTAVEPRTRQGDRRDVNVDDVVRSRGSRSNCHQSSRRHNRDQCHDRPGKKLDRRTTQSADEPKRTRSSRTHRR